MKLNITKVSSTNLKKDGTPILSKFGKPAWRVGIQTKEYGATWINGFLPFEPRWEGTEQELNITDKEFNGQMQKNFEVPRKEDKTIEMLSQVLTKLGLINSKIDFMADMLDIKGKAVEKGNYLPRNEMEYPDEDIALEDMKF